MNTTRKTYYTPSCSYTKFSIQPPIAVARGHGYLEFVKPSYQVPSTENRVKVRVRRRGSFGHKKQSTIFTRDREAEEGKDYFCEGNNAGIIRFGPNEFYKGELIYWHCNSEFFFIIPKLIKKIK